MADYRDYAAEQAQLEAETHGAVVRAQRSLELYMGSSYDQPVLLSRRDLHRLLDALPKKWQKARESPRGD